MRIFGIHAVTAAIKRSPESCKKVWVKKQPNKRLQALHDLARQNGVAATYVENEYLDSLTPDKHQGVVMEVTSLPQSEDVMDNLNGRALLVLDQVSDTRNLGACLRLADAFGVAAIIVPKDNSAKITDATTKVAAGAVATTPVVPVTNLSRALKDLKDQGYWIIGTDMDGTDLSETKLPQPAVIVMGSEGRGLREQTKKHCDMLVKIPMVGTVESLNVATAAAIFMWENFKAGLDA